MDFFVNLRKKLLMDTNDKCILRAVGISENPEAGGLLKKKVLPILRHGPLLLDRLVDQNPFSYSRYVA